MRIAWVSRHKPTQTQIGTLLRMFGDQTTLIPLNDTYRSADELFQELKKYKIEIAIVVLPLSVISKLIPLCRKEGIELWWPKMQKLHDCRGPPSCPEFDYKSDVWLPYYRSDIGRHMRFVRFERIKEVRLITEPVDGAEGAR